MRRAALALPALVILAGTVRAQEWKTQGTYPTKPALLEYTDPHSPSYDKDNNILWFDKEFFEKNKIDPKYIQVWKVDFKVENGQLVCYTSFGKKVQTPERIDPHTYAVINPEPDYALFVMDAAGDFYLIKQDWIAWNDPAGAPKIHHSTIPAGKGVAAAGKIQVVDGIIKYIDNESGHYLPDNRQLVAAINSLERKGISKGDLKGKVKFFNRDDPGPGYAELDPQVKEKAAKYGWKGDQVVAEKPGEEGKPPVDNEADLLKPEDRVQRAQLDAERRAQLQRKFEGRRPAAEKPVEPPSTAIKNQIEELIKTTDVKDMTVEWMRSLYKTHPESAKLVGQMLANPGYADKNYQMGQLRKQMDLMVWKEVLKRHNIPIEITNQGKNNGIKSDLDYTLYYVAEEGGLTIADLIKEHDEVWKDARLGHGLSPEQLEIKVMNGDEFYPDWRNEALSEWDHIADVRRLLGVLRQDKEKYSVPGANKQQVHNRALRDGWTELLEYKPELDKPGVPIEDQVIYDAGETRLIAERYHGVHPQYNHMNALGNVVQNMGEYLHHTGDGAQDLIRRSKYSNRIIEALGTRFFANSYQQIYGSKLPQDQKDALLRDYLKKTFGVLSDDNGRPLLDDAALADFKKIIDIQMKIELEKTNPDPNDKRTFDEKQAEYFKDYRTEAEATVTRELENQNVAAELREKLIRSEQQYLFELKQRRVLAEAVLAGLRQSVARDLTPEGVLRNRIRFDPATSKFVLDDPAGARKVAFERALEVALFYELVNGIPDRDLRLDMKKRALSTAPDIEVAEFYGALDQVNGAEIDRFIAGDPNSKVQRKIDDLLKKQQDRALELAIERKQRVVDAVKAKGVPVDPSAVPPDQVRDNIIENRLWTLTPERRAQFTAAFKELGFQLKGDFQDAFHNNASALMMGSSAVNIIRAYQSGGAKALPHAVFSEAIWYMPDYIQTPFLVADLLIKVKQGQYVEAAWSASLFTAMARFPALGHAMLAYNIITGSVDIIHTHFVTHIDKDLTEQALKARPREKNGGPLADGKRARPNRWPEAKQSVYNGSGPWFPLFYGRYKNQQAIAPVAVVDGVKYSDGSVPQDNLSDDELADSAAVEFAPQIDSILTAAGYQPGTQDWAVHAWDLKLKFGFDIPFYRRVARVYDEKYKYITFSDYLSECRLDVYDWYAQQIGPSGQTGYHDELRGDASFFFGDQTDKMQELIARECAGVLDNYRKTAEAAEELDQTNRAAFKTRMSQAFDAERGLVAAKQALQQRIQTREEKATSALEQKAIDLAQQHQTYFAIRYPFTYGTEELPPNLEFVTRTLPATIKQPVRVTLDEEVIGVTEGAPGGWEPGKDYADRFKPDSTGWTQLRPITMSVRFTAHLLDADSTEVAQDKLELPIVMYEPSLSGNISVTVYGLGEKGDSSLYNGALVTLGTETKETGPIYGNTGFGKLKAGSYSVKVTPRKGDERHGPGSGSGAIVDVLLSKDPNAKDYAAIVVKLPYIPEKPIADSTANKGGHQPPPGGGGGKPPGGKTGRDSTATNDSTGAKGKTDSTAVKQPTADELIAKLPALTSQAEAARKAAIAACNYTDAVAAQEQVVAAAKDFLAKAFPNGAPPDVLEKAEAFETELAVLKKAAAGAEAAKVHIREARAAVRAKHGEPALTALEAAINTQDIPPCLREQAQSLYDEIKSDLEKRMVLIDKAVDAANNHCDYIAALKFGEEVEAQDPNLSWVTKELPRIKDLARRQKSARDLAAQAEGKAQQAEGLAQNGGDMAQANALFDEALQLAQQALAAAPACEKENLKSLMDLPARKAALSNPKVDQSLVLLLDTSGSMADNNKMENAKSAATDAVKSLGPTTEVALISYDGGCAGGWRINQAFTTNHQSVISAIAMLHPGGGTPTAPAIGFAHDYLEKNGRGKAGQIMLMTDGQNDCGSMVDAGAGLRRSLMPVQIDAVGFGLGTDSKAQQDLGDLVRAAGNGNAYNANDAKELISAFRRAFITSQIRPRDPFVTGDAGAQLSQLFAAAVEFLKQNNLRSAVDQFKTATDKFPNSSAAAYNASLAYEASGQPLQAMNYAKKYLQLAPNAFDAGQVGARIDMLEKEQAANPRAIYSPTDCNTLYSWAQRESRVGGMDAVRKAKVFDILTTAQRGDCAAAQAAYDKYTQQYGKRP